LNTEDEAKIASDLLRGFSRSYSRKPKRRWLFIRTHKVPGSYLSQVISANTNNNRNKKKQIKEQKKILWNKWVQPTDEEEAKSWHAYI
jgi:hypothetical protein